MFPSSLASNRSLHVSHPSSLSLQHSHNKSTIQQVDSLLTDCSEVQQSLRPIWKSAYVDYSDSFHLLESSRLALKYPPERQISWPSNRHYESSKRLSALRTPHNPSKPTPVDQNWRLTEQAELLSEIQRYRKSEVELGDTFKPVSTPKHTHTARKEKLSKSHTMSDLNRFILKVQSRFTNKSLPRLPENVLENAKKRILKPIFSRKIQSSTHRVSQITKDLIVDFQSNGGYSPDRKAIQAYYKRMRPKKGREQTSILRLK